MSLIPIIYTSLMIFSALTVVIIVLSFISYKIKEKNNPAVAVGQSSVQYNTLRSQYIAQPRIVQKERPVAVQRSNHNITRTTNPFNQKLKSNRVEDHHSARKTVVRNTHTRNNSNRYGDFWSERKRPERRFEVFTTFEGNNDRTAQYNVANNQDAYMNYYSNDSTVYFPFCFCLRF